MSIGNGLSRGEELPKKSKLEEPEDSQNINLKEDPSFGIEKERQNTKEQGAINLAEVRASLGLEKIDEKDDGLTSNKYTSIINLTEIRTSIGAEKLDEDGLTPEEREMAEYFLPKFKEAIVAEKEKRDCRQEVSSLQNLFNEFETKHPIDELYSIIDLTYKDAPNHPVREPARQDLIPIFTSLNILKKETNIPTEEYDELNAQYKHLSNAVGLIKGDKVRH